MTLTLLSSILATGCGFMIGGERSRLPSEPPTARYAVRDCAVTDGQGPLNEPEGQMYLLYDTPAGPEVYERKSTGEVTRFTNRWSEPDGTHAFFFHGPLKTGYHLTVPGDRAVAGVRHLYLRRVPERREVEGSIRPIGPPSATCALVPF